MTAPLTVSSSPSVSALGPLPDTALLANAIRALAMDAVQAANSGHPGMPTGMAEIAFALCTRHLRHNPANPHWADRDRLVLSNGHGSMLQYALLHLTGYGLPLDQLRFRQLHSKTPGHPELRVGVETTTGPLGQGLANLYRDAVLARGVRRVAVEAGATDYWRKYVGRTAPRSASTPSASQRQCPRCSTISGLRSTTSSAQCGGRSSAALPF